MIQSLAVGLASLVLGVLLVGPAYAGDDRARSPEDVFKAFASAMKGEDVRGAMSHLTRDSQSWITGMALVWSMVSREFSADDRHNGKERIAAIEQALKRHGVSYDAARWKSMGSLKDSFQQVVALGEPVKDKPALAGDLLKIVTRLQNPSVFKAIGTATLKDVAIDREAATGRVTSPIAAEKDNPTRASSIFELALLSATEGAATFYFRLEDGVWKIDLFETCSNIPPPPPPPQPQRPAARVQPPVIDCEPRPGLVRRWCPCPGRR
jgi:hypothetical protein